MTLFFIQESKEQNRCKYKINSILNKIEEKIDGNKIFLTLPIKIVGAHDCAPKKAKEIKPKKIKKLINELEKYNIKTAILSEQLYSIEPLKNELYAKNVNLLDGRYLFKLLTENVIKYICGKSITNIEEIEISILTNDRSNINEQIIKELAEKVKTLNIITNHIDEFKKLEDYLYNEKGIIIKLSNNYKTALQKTNIIINMDLPEEIINKYVIPNKCIIVNFNGEIKIKYKKFNGININNYNILIPGKCKIQGYSDKLIYESILLNKEYKEAKKQILKDKILIQNLIGEKGIINNKEFFFFPWQNKFSNVR